MPRMRAADAAVKILELEGATQAFGLPGAAINPFYSAMRDHGGIKHVLARHVEGASHMAEGYTRAKAGNIGICIGTSGPAGTDMITGLYSAMADSIPILAITGQAPVARLHKEDFQAVDIAAIAAPVTKMAMTVLEPAQVPGAFAQAFHLMRSGRPGPVLIDLPIDVQLAEIDFDPDTYQPLPVYKPAATRAQAEKALDMLAEARATVDRRGRRHHQRRRLGPAGRAGRAAGRAGGADPDGLGHDPRRSPPFRRDGRSADRAPVRQRHDAGRRTSSWVSATGGPTATPAGSTPTAGAASSCTSTSNPPRSAGCSHPTTASSPTPRPRSSSSSPSPGSARPTARRRTAPPGWRTARPVSAPCNARPTSTRFRSSRSGCTKK